MSEPHSPRWIAPPLPDRADGARRRVGVEIEFSGLDVRSAAQATARRLGGSVRTLSPHLAMVEGTEFGEFRIELDMRLAHAEVGGEIERALRDFAAELGAVVVPVEIVCPPIPWDRAHALDDLRADLHRMGAEGTRDALLYAFGAQLNIEPPDLEAETLLALMRAFVVLRDWLRAEVQIDTLRWLTVFASPWPTPYCAHILRPGYAPSRERLIDDYLKFNPTRDRELDLLPIFAALDERRVRAALPEEKIRPRPAWHYRLPNSEVNAWDWSIGLEWARWVRIERLAANADFLDAACGEWRTNLARTFPHDWETRSTEIARAL